MKEKLYSNVFSDEYRDEYIDFDIGESDNSCNSECCAKDSSCGLAEDILLVKSIFSDDTDFGEFDFDLSVAGDCGTLGMPERELGIPEGFTGLLNDGSYLDKILASMQSIERWMYHREMERSNKPTDLKSLMQCLINLRERITTIPKTFRNSIYLCVYTKFSDMGIKHGLSQNEYYRIYYEHLPDLSDYEEFLYGVERDARRFFDMSNLDKEQRRKLKREMQVLMYNLRKVS